MQIEKSAKVALARVVLRQLQREKQAVMGRAAIQFAKQAPKWLKGLSSASGIAGKAAPEAIPRAASKLKKAPVAKAPVAKAPVAKAPVSPAGPGGRAPRTPQSRFSEKQKMQGGFEHMKQQAEAVHTPGNTYMARPKSSVQSGLDIDALPDWLQSQVRDQTGPGMGIRQVIDQLKSESSFGNGRLAEIFKSLGY
jgi:hypothetical protein